MPGAWITRFGRTVASQVVEAVGSRFESRGGNHIQVGGFALNGAQEPFAGEDDGRLGIEDLAWNPVERAQSMTACASSCWGARSASTQAARTERLRSARGATSTSAASRPRTTGSCSTGTSQPGSSAPTSLATVGSRGSRSRSRTATASSRPWRAKTRARSRPRSRASTRTRDSRLSEKVDAWGLVGLGSGELTLRSRPGRHGERTELTTDIAMRMGAVGVRGEVLTPTEPGGLAIAVKSDAFWVRTESDKVRMATGHLGAAKGEATRLRLLVEGSRSFDSARGTLTPSAEVGVRHDGGDAETGTGIEAGAAARGTRAEQLHASKPRSGDSSRTKRAGYEEWGASGTVRIAPGASGRGLSLSIAPTLGTPASGTGALWSARDARSLVPYGEFEAGRRVEAEVGYGLGAPAEPRARHALRRSLARRGADVADRGKVAARAGGDRWGSRRSGARRTVKRPR